MEDSYVCSGAKIKCTFGDKISSLTVLPLRTIFLTGQPQANISDHTPFVNIAPFGKCHTITFPATGAATAAAHGKLTPMPCVPNTPFPWMGGKNDVLLQGQPALLKSSKCNCVFGGIISITFDGQTPGNQIMKPTVPKEDFLYPYIERFGMDSIGSNIDISKNALIAKGYTDEQAEKYRNAVLNQRRKFAFQFYQDSMKDWPKGRIESHLSGIDFEKPVAIEMIPPPDTVYQFCGYKKDGTLMVGNYTTPDPNASASELGIAEVFALFKGGEINQKRKIEMSVTQPRRILKTTATSISDNWSVPGVLIETKGGGTQFFMGKS